VGTIQIRIHENTGEIEISPFKSRAKLLFCDECGKRMVPEPVNKDMLKKIHICRRKKTAESLAMISSKKNIND
jgi:hypothetical protein